MLSIFDRNFFDETATTAGANNGFIEPNSVPRKRYESSIGNAAMKILSISDCHGWFALFRDDNDGPEFVPLACWALVRDAYLKGEDDVIGLIVDSATHLIERAADADNFVGYLHEKDRDRASEVLAPKMRALSRRTAERRLRRRFEEITA